MQKKRKYTDKNMPSSKKEKLEEMKKKVRRSLEHDKRNFDYFNDMKSFICKSTLDEDTLNKLALLKRPQLECNEIEQFVNTLLGEFKDFEPSINIRPSSTITDQRYAAMKEQTAKVIEGYLRYKLTPRATDNNIVEMFADIIRGGLSAATIEIGWASDDPFEFNTDIFIKKEPYPTMCGWDVMAVDSHRGDGRYCYKMTAYDKNQAVEMYGKECIDKIKPSPSLQGFNWSYMRDTETYYMFCEFYEKETKKIKVHLLSDGQKMTDKEYVRFLKEWDEEGNIEIPPIPVQTRDDAEEVTIWQYVFNETTILSCVETDYKYLPILRAQGGAVKLEDGQGANKQEICRSYVHNLKGIQMLKNTAAQGVAFEIENTIASKFIMEYETVIPSQMDQLINNQVPSVILYQSRPRRGDSESEAYPPPIPIQRPPVPQIIPETFIQTSAVMRRMMGVMDNGGIPSNVSTDTIRTAYTQESRVSFPWRWGLDDVLNRMGTILMDLIPKVFKTPSTIPVITRDGKRSFVSINDQANPESVFMDFNPSEFNIEISAGVNGEILKHAGMNQIMELSRTFQDFNHFIDQECKPDLIENLDVKNKGSLVLKAQEYQKMQQQAKQQSSHNQPMDPVRAQMQIEQAKIMQKSQLDQATIAQKEKKMQIDAAIASAKIQQDDRKTEMELIKTLSTVKSDQAQQIAAKQKSQSENIRSAALLATELAKHQSNSRHKHLDRIYQHAMSMPKQENNVEVSGEQDK